jgi:hypothetical protein
VGEGTGVGVAGTRVGVADGVGVAVAGTRVGEGEGEGDGDGVGDGVGVLGAARAATGAASGRAVALDATNLRNLRLKRYGGISGDHGWGKESTGTRRARPPLTYALGCGGSKGIEITRCVFQSSNARGKRSDDRRRAKNL